MIGLVIGQSDDRQGLLPRILSNICVLQVKKETRESSGVKINM